MGLGWVKFGPGGSLNPQNWVLGTLDGGLEGPGTVRMAILGLSEAVWAPTWSHLEAFWDRLLKILGSQIHPETQILGSEWEICNIEKTLILTVILPVF